MLQSALHSKKTIRKSHHHKKGASFFSKRCRLLVENVPRVMLFAETEKANLMGWLFVAHFLAEAIERRLSQLRLIPF